MKIYIGNLPYQATETELQDWFGNAGVAVDAIQIIRDRFSGESRGFGFVEIDDEAAGSHAVTTCNGQDFMGRSLVVNEARPKMDRGGGGGDPRGGGGGRGRRY